MLWVAGVFHPVSFGAPVQKTFLFLVQVLLLPPANTHWMPVGKPAVTWTVLVASCFASAALGLFKNDDWLSSSTLMMTNGDIPFAKMWFIKKRVPVAWWIERESSGKLNLLVLHACMPPEAGIGVDIGHEGWIHKARRLAIIEKFGISLWCFSYRFISFCNWAGLSSMSTAWLLYLWVWPAQCWSQQRLAIWECKYMILYTAYANTVELNFFLLFLRLMHSYICASDRVPCRHRWRGGAGALCPQLHHAQVQEVGRCTWSSSVSQRGADLVTGLALFAGLMLLGEVVVH